MGEVVQTVAEVITKPVTKAADVVGVKIPGSGAGQDIFEAVVNPITASNAFGASAGTASSLVGVGETGVNAVKENVRKTKEGFMGKLNQQDEAFRNALADVSGNTPGTPLSIDPTKDPASAPIAEEKAVERAKKRIIKPVKQGRASTILTSPLGIPGANDGSGQGGKRLLGL